MWDWGERVSCLSCSMNSLWTCHNPHEPAGCFLCLTLTMSSPPDLRYWLYLLLYTARCFEHYASSHCAVLPALLQTRSGQSKAATLTERAEWDVRIMTYNILAEGLVRGGWTGMCLARPACMRLPQS